MFQVMNSVHEISRCGGLFTWMLSARQVVLDLCRGEQGTETETIEMHLERIKALISTWTAQVGEIHNVFSSL